MRIRLRFAIAGAAVAVVLCTAGASVGVAASLSFVGAQYDLPFGGLGGAHTGPYLQAGWRTSTPLNVYAQGTAYPEQYYGKAGYALFATAFTHPDASATPLDANIPIAGNASFKNIASLPSWVTGSQIHATRLAGGGVYDLIDDPRLMVGERWWSFDGVNYPPPTPSNNTGQNPYLQIGFIVGAVANGAVDPSGNPDRWSFTVGAGVPAQFRIGVMNDGLNDSNFASNSILMRRLGDDASLVTSGSLTNRNRLVDMIFFDIKDAQPGNTYVISASASNSRIGGISFDVVVPEPATASLIVLAAACAMGLIGRFRRQ